MAGIILLSYIAIFLLSPKDITDYTVADIEAWRETGNRLMLKTAYEYNNKEDLQAFPKNLGEWSGVDFRYYDAVYKSLKADILLSRTYTKNGSGFVWTDFINGKVGESFHNPRSCLAGAWDIDNESTVEFRVAEYPNPFTKLYAKRLDYSRKNDKNNKQVMVYWFMFKKAGSRDDVTMVRLSSPVIYNETVTFNIIKDFIENELFKAMYKQAEPETITVGEDVVNTYGTTGRAMIALALLIPFGLVFSGLRRKN